jgi:hypothetical protein
MSGMFDRQIYWVRKLRNRCYMFFFLSFELCLVSLLFLHLRGGGERRRCPHPKNFPLHLSPTSSSGACQIIFYRICSHSVKRNKV